jgi:hypothetical protein
MTTSYLLQDARGAVYPINGPTRVGRDPNCQVRLPDPEVSRSHAIFWVERGNLYLRDDHTPNGTYLDEWRIPPGKPVAVSVGSRVSMGQTVLTVISLQPSPVLATVIAPAQKVVPPSRTSQRTLLLLGGAGCLGFGLLIVVLIYLFFLARAYTPGAQALPGMAVLLTSWAQDCIEHTF